MNVAFRLERKSHSVLVERAEAAGLSTRAWIEEAILKNQTRIFARQKPHPDLTALLTCCARRSPMLARISSGADGVVSYLQTGRKKGREFARDMIDERIVLDVDIDILDATIDGIVTKQPGAARYMHITLGFSERFTTAGECEPGEVDAAKLGEVADSYREMLMAAYGRDEYCWYAEAHAHQGDARRACRYRCGDRALTARPHRFADA